MESERREQLTEKLAEELPVLRAKLRLSQSDLAERLGLSRQQIVAIETKKRKMTWSTFLAVVLIFKNNAESAQLLSALGIYTDELDGFITGVEHEGL